MDQKWKSMEDVALIWLTKVEKECEALFVVVNKDCTPLLGSKTVQEMKLIELNKLTAFQTAT